MILDSYDWTILSNDKRAVQTLSNVWMGPVRISFEKIIVQTSIIVQIL